MSTYCDANNITIFPSSNAVDSGKIVSEENIRGLITGLKLNNYKANASEFNLSNSNPNVVVSSGTAYIHGYKIVTTSPVTIDSPGGTGVYNVLMSVQLSDDHIIGDRSELGRTVCGGVVFACVDQSEEITDEDLLLGTASYTSGSLSKVETNNSCLQPFSTDSITIDEYTEQLSPGSLTEELVITIPNTYVSKIADDTKVGFLKLKPDNGNVTINLNPTTSLIETFEGINSSKLNTTDLKFTVSGTETTLSSEAKLSSDGRYMSFAVNDYSYLNINPSSSITLSGNSSKVNVGTGVNDVDIYNSGSKITLKKNENNSYSVSTFIGSDEMTKVSSTGVKINRLNIDNANNITSTESKISIFPTLQVSNETISGSLTIGSTTITSTGMSITSGSSIASSIGSNLATTGYIASTSDLSLSSGALYSKIDKNTITINSSSSTDGSINFNVAGSSKASIKYSNSQNQLNVAATKMVVSGEFSASKVYNAVYNGVGEIFRKDKNEIIEYGDVVCIGSDGLVHKVRNQFDVDKIIGICSDTIGFELGGKDIPEEEQVEVEFLGQIWVKTTDTEIFPGEPLKANDNGTVSVCKDYSNKFAIALTGVVDGKVRVFYSGH